MGERAWGQRLRISYASLASGISGLPDPGDEGARGGRRLAPGASEPPLRREACIGMTGSSGDDRRGGPDRSRAWLLNCQGMRVEDSEGRTLGRVLAPIYEFSARWDRPTALDVESPDGSLTVPLDWIAEVDEARRRVIVGHASGGLAAEDTPPRQ